MKRHPLYIFAILLLTTNPLHAQQPDSLPPAKSSQTQISSDSLPIGQDTTRQIMSIDMTSVKPQFTPLDTNLLASRNHHPIYQIDGAWSDLGNTATPGVMNRMKSIPKFELPFLLTGFKHYLNYDNPIIRYVTTQPFSLINYNSGGSADKNGQTIYALYTRNLSPFSNLTAQLRYYTADGHYNSQKSSVTTMSAHYSILKKHYRLYTRMARRTFSLSENGGIVNDQDLIDSYYPSTIPVNLTKASSNTKLFSWKAIQEFDLTAWPKRDTADSVRTETRQLLPFKLIHKAEWSSSKRLYSDSDPTGEFYQHIYMDSTQTNDSIDFVMLNQELLFSFEKWRPGKFSSILQAGIEPRWFRYIWSDTLLGSFDLSIIARALLESDRIRWKARAGFTGLGYHFGDLFLAGSFGYLFRKDSLSPEISTSLEMIRARPDPTMAYYSTNHFAWNNEFSTQSQYSASLRLTIPSIKLTFSSQAKYLQGWIYFNQEALPNQLNTPLMAADVRLQKTFKAGPFRSILDAAAQYSSGNEMPLPTFVGTSTNLMHHDIHFKSTGGFLELEYGFDIRFWTRYYAYAYMPATGIFHLQNDKTIGNYPALDAFAQIKIKRTRIFVQYNHLLGPLFLSDYFGTLHHPFPQPHLKYGVYWHFYD